MIGVVLAWLAAIACIVVSARRVQRVSALAREAAPAEVIERASRERLLDKLPPEGAPGRVAREVLAAPSERAAVATLNEALSDIARDLEVSREVPKSAARVALASGALVGIVELARRVPSEGALALRSGGMAFAAGLVGGFACWMLGRTAEGEARQCRIAWDRLSRALERIVAGADVGKATSQAGPERISGA